MDVIDSPRIEELRRRVQKDPTSIAFAQLAEEYRRLGAFQEAVQVCLAGLAHHPSYLSARVTLGRALMELGELGDARKELEAVMKVAPDNLAAIRALAEIHQRHVVSKGAFDAHTPTAHIAPDEPLATPVVPDAARMSNNASASPIVTTSAASVPVSAALVDTGAQMATSGETADEPTSSPVVEELERWLAAIEAERSHRR